MHVCEKKYIHTTYYIHTKFSMPSPPPRVEVFSASERFFTGLERSDFPSAEFQSRLFVGSSRLPKQLFVSNA